MGSVDSKGAVSTFSNFGTGIDLVAPGEDFVSTGPLNEYYQTGGTSASAAFVTGIVSLILGTNNDLGSQEIKTILKETSSGNGLWDEKIGYGIINPKETIQYIFGDLVLE